MDWKRLILEYAVYAAVIVIGIVILGILKKRSRPPRHGELKRSLLRLQEDYREFCKDAAEGKRYDFFKRVSKLLYATDRLISEASALAEKERDGEIGSVSVALEGARGELAPYKYAKKEREDRSGMDAALAAVDRAVCMMERVIARDEQMKAIRNR